MKERVVGTHVWRNSTNDARLSPECNCNTAHPFLSSPSVSVHRRLAGDVLAPVGTSDID